MKKYIVLFCLPLMLLAACSKKNVVIPAYTVSKSFKTDSVTTVNVAHQQPDDLYAACRDSR